MSSSSKQTCLSRSGWQLAISWYKRARSPTSSATKLCSSPIFSALSRSSVSLPRDGQVLCQHIAENLICGSRYFGSDKKSTTCCSGQSSRGSCERQRSHLLSHSRAFLPKWRTCATQRNHHLASSGRSALLSHFWHGLRLRWSTAAKCAR